MGGLPLIGLDEPEEEKDKLTKHMYELAEKKLEHTKTAADVQRCSSMRRQQEARPRAG